jgi:hypothetical protein
MKRLGSTIRQSHVTISKFVGVKSVLCTLLPRHLRSPRAQWCFNTEVAPTRGGLLALCSCASEKICNVASLPPDVNLFGIVPCT